MTFRIVPIAFVTVLLGLSAVTPAQAADRQIVVTGEGRVAAAPDMATVSLGVHREARAADAAMSATSEAARAVLDTLAAAGIAPADIQTTRIGLEPRYQHSNDGAPPRITGYVASNDLSVRVRDLDGLGGVLDSVIADGANNFAGISFGLTDSGPLEEEARALAVRDARARAETLAAAAGVQLGAVQTITEMGGFVAPEPMMRGAMMEAAMVPVAEGQIDVTVQVSVVFAIAE